MLATLMADNRYTRSTRRKQLTVLASKPEAQMQIPEEQEHSYLFAEPEELEIPGLRSQSQRQLHFIFYSSGSFTWGTWGKCVDIKYA